MDCLRIHFNGSLEEIGLNSGGGHIQALGAVPVPVIDRGIEIPIVNMGPVPDRYGRSGCGLVIMGMAVFIDNPVLGIMNMALARRDSRSGDIQALMGMMGIARCMGHTAVVMVDWTFFIFHCTYLLQSMI